MKRIIDVYLLKQKTRDMKANKTISKNYQGVNYTFTKTMNGYSVSDGSNRWTQLTPSVREAKRRREL